MNIVTKMVVERDQDQAIEFIYRFYIKLISGFVYLKKRSMTMIKSYKLIFNGFAYKKILSVDLEH